MTPFGRDVEFDPYGPPGLELAELERSEFVQNRPCSPAEVRHVNHRNEGSRLLNPGTCRIFRKKYRGCHSKCHHPRIKDHPRNEMVRSRAIERPYRKRVCPILSGHFASWIHSRGVVFAGKAEVNLRSLDRRRRDCPSRSRIRSGADEERPGFALTCSGRHDCAVSRRLPVSSGSAYAGQHPTGSTHADRELGSPG
jgi:hypothetical protein